MRVLLACYVFVAPSVKDLEDILFNTTRNETTRHDATWTPPSHYTPKRENTVDCNARYS
jgi:hypothetical protein